MPIAAQDLVALSRLLDEAMDLPPVRLEAWLDALPAEHAHLATQLRRMLAARTGAPEFLQSTPRLATDESVAHAGDLVGAYRLVREIGHGGMGDVWLADRADGSLKRNVALKLPRLAWGAGLADRIARERDIGALLEHPNIARLYDAGIDERGRPFLALEYVDGVPLDQWCKSNALSITERLRLFLQIARAVSYAHGRLVVHRDLKPSNVLVTPDGQAQLLDFGIAKLLDDSSPSGNLTQEQGRVLTPHYASPEQIRGETITVASDVYSLGVLLYELLSGTLPYAHLESKTLASLERAIFEGEMPLPSSKVGDRQASKALKGELDAILCHALKSQPHERYATADAFAQDVERHLKGERVLAQPESIRYRLARGLRRHRAAFAAGAAVVVAILGGAGVSLVQAKRANDAAERARVVKEFVVDVFKVNERGTARSMELRQLPAELLLDRGAKLIQTRFPGRPELQAELYGVVGGIFADMGANSQAAEYATKQVEALVAIDAKAADQAKGMILLTQALLADGRVSDARVRADRALVLSDSSDELRPEALVLLARVMYTQGDREGTQRMLDRADRDLARLHRPTTAAASGKSLRASMLLTSNRFDEALPQYVSAIDTALAAEGASSPTAIRIRLSLAWSLVIVDRPEEAKSHLEAALSALRDSGGPGEIGAALNESRFFSHMYAGMSPSQVPFAEARAMVERDRDVVERQGPLVPAKIKASIERELSMVLVRWGDLAAATPLSEHSHAILGAETEAPGARWNLANSEASLAALLGRHDRATVLFHEVVELRRKMGEGNHPWASYDHAKVAMNFRMQGKFAEAERAIAAAPRFEALRGAGAASEGYEYILALELAAVKLARGEPGEALKLMPPESTDLKSSIFFPYDQMLLRGEILCALGRHEEGLPKLKSAVELHEALVAPQDPRLAHARSVQGLCALRGGQEGLAHELEVLSREAFEAQPDVSPYFKVPLKVLQDRLRERRPTKLAARR